ncbi:MAG: DsbA family protein [Pseudomonadota bacterium]
MTLRLPALAALAAAVLAAAAPPAAAQTIDREALRGEIRAYLLDNPEVIVEALEALEARRQREALGDLAELVDDGELISAVGPDAGDDGVVTVIELTDYNCPYCRRAQPEVQALLAADPKVRHVVKALPYIGEDVAERAAVAATLQGAPEKTRAFHAALMSHNGPLDLASIERMAGGAGLDSARIMAEMRSDAVTERLGRTVDAAGALGVRGTPAFVIGDTVRASWLPAEELIARVAAARSAAAE